MALYSYLAVRPGNLVLSPANVRLALGMTYAGARGRTADEMARVLCLPGGDEAYAEAHDEMAAQLVAWEAQPSWRDRALLCVANRLWANRGHAFAEAFLSRLSDSYRMPLGTLDFVRAPVAGREAINRWVSEQTAQKVKAILPPSLITPATRLVLTSVAHFHARWVNPFDRGRTRQGAFFTGAQHQVQAPFMSQINAFGLAEFRGGRLVELPCGTGQLVMDVILPDAPDGLPQLEQQLFDGALAAWIGALAQQVVMVSIPRFRIASDLALADGLRELGVIEAFTSQSADFSGMDGTRELYLSEVLHQAEVEVDEQATEAAPPAAAHTMAGDAPRADVPVFHADHPFLFLIRDPRSAAIVFLGRLTNPL